MRTSMRRVTLMRMHKKTAIESRRRIVSHSHTACQLQHQLGCWVVLGLATAGAIAAAAAATRRLSIASATVPYQRDSSARYVVFSVVQPQYSPAPTPPFFPCLATHCLPNPGQLATHYQYIYIVYMYACCLQPQWWFILICVHAGASIASSPVPITTYSCYMDSIPALKLQKFNRWCKIDVLYC